MRRQINRGLCIIVIIVGALLLMINACKKVKLPSLTTAEVTDCFATSATSGGNITDDGGADVIARGLCWSSDTRPTISNSKTSDGEGTGSFTSSLTGLIPNTDYYLRAYATNSAGTGYGNENSFTTRPVTPVEITTKDVIKDFNDDLYPGAFTGGTIISDGDMFITSRGVCWSTSQSPTTSNNKTSDGTGNGSFSSYIKSSLLGKGTTYYVRAYATYSSGTAYGNQVSFTTPCTWGDYGIQHFGLISPANGAIGQSTNTSLKWIINGYDSGNADVYFGTSSAPTTKIATNYASQSISVSGLDPGTTYYWKVFRRNPGLPCDTGTTAIWHFTTTTEIKAPVVLTIAVTAYTSTSARVGGNVDSGEGSTVIERGVYWGTSQNPESTGTSLRLGSGTGLFSTTISGLSINTTYYVKAYAANSVGTSYGAQVRFNLTGEYEKVTDIDGNIYNMVTIGSQVWMAENLKTTRYSNGDLIGTTTPATLNLLGVDGTKYQWAYGGNESNVATYGRLYTWYAVTDSRNVCPTGWHLPNDAEWTTLTDYLTNNGHGYGGSGSEIAFSLAATSGWTTSTMPGSPGYDQTSNNSSRFTALPGGQRIVTGTFSDVGNYGYWWSSTVWSTWDAWYRYIISGGIIVDRIYIDKDYGFSVRCLKD